MKIYNITRTQILPIDLKTAWSFFSSPDNLAMITPPKMNFKILYISGKQQIYAGQLIRYKVNVPPGIPIHWVTEITQVSEPYYFIDEQRFGPYAFWHHQHHFKAVSEGVEIIDELNYAMPLGLLGRLANTLFVERQVNTIFDYRYQFLKDHFSIHPIIK